jgi:hypothetical protein
MSGLEIFFLVGSIAGIATLYWQIYKWASEKWVYAPKIKISTQIKYANGKPDKVIITAVNSGAKTIHIVSAGFHLSDKTDYYYEFGGGLLRWVRSWGGTYETEFPFEELREVIRNKEGNVTIERAFVTSDNYKLYKGKIPEELNGLIHSQPHPE